MKRAYTRVDTLYCVVLAVTAAGCGTVLGAMFGEEELMALMAEYDGAAACLNLGLGLSPLAALLLFWRVWLVWRYRAVSPCADAALPVTTVVIPAYNEGSHVLLAIRSVMASDYPAEKLQVVCVDDGSRDDTLHWMREAAREFPGRLTLVRQPGNSGKRHALLAGLARARGAVLVTMDSDSVVRPDSLRHLVSPLAVAADVGTVAGNVRVLNLDAGPIAAMLDVNFTMCFDFLRRGQSVYGGVLCTPGALSAYRLETLAPDMAAWADQTFMGGPANIGEDRALSNIVLARGLKVVFQKDAVVETAIPAAYPGLRRMLLRWARSNVRECLVMAFFLGRRFRPSWRGAGWVRLAGALELFSLPAAEILKVAFVAGLILHPEASLRILVAGCLMSSLVPALVFQFRRRGAYGLVWAVAYSFYWTVALSWITLWGLASAARSGWLTRQLPAEGTASMAIKGHAEAA